MKINIIKSICFILILIICLVILSNLFVPKNNSEDYGIHFKDASGILAEQDNTIDVLFVGNSEIYTSVIPPEIWNEYGYTGYVCASADQTLPQCLDFIYKIYKKQKVKVIVLEINNSFRTTTISDAINHVLQYNFKIFQYHNRWKKLNLSDFKQKPQYNLKNYLKGYKYSNDIKKFDGKKHEDKYETADSIPLSNKIYLKIIDLFCKNRDIKLITVCTPIKKNWDESNKIAIQEFLKNNNIEFLDLNDHQEDIKIDWEKDTKDGGEHLNYTGALKTTKFIGKYLNDKNILTSHKDDENYSKWNDDYNKYIEYINKKEGAEQYESL